MIIKEISMMKNQELQNLVQSEIKNRESVSDIIGINMMK